MMMMMMIMIVLMCVVAATHSEICWLWIIAGISTAVVVPAVVIIFVWWYVQSLCMLHYHSSMDLISQIHATLRAGFFFSLHTIAMTDLSVSCIFNFSHFRYLLNNLVSDVTVYVI